MEKKWFYDHVITLIHSLSLWSCIKSAWECQFSSIFIEHYANL